LNALLEVFVKKSLLDVCAKRKSADHAASIMQYRHQAKL